jgi:hypothetical protein
MNVLCDMMKRRLRAWTLVSATLVLPACGSDEGTGPTAPQPEEIELSVRVHLLSSDFAPLNTLLTEAEVGTVFSRVNEVWRQALEVGTVFSRVNEVWRQALISWEIESIIREEALNADAFALVLQGQLLASDDIIASVLPRANLSGGAWDVFLILDLGGIAGGIYFPGIPAALSAELDPSGNRELTGSAARILAHELGHSLGLPHVACTAEGNLMAPGCPAVDRTRLLVGQIGIARRQAETGRPFGSGAAID